jgi:hypothetical protein
VIAHPLLSPESTTNTHPQKHTPTTLHTTKKMSLGSISEQLDCPSPFVVYPFLHSLMSVGAPHTNPRGQVTQVDFVDSAALAKYFPDPHDGAAMAEVFCMHVQDPLLFIFSEAPVPVLDLQVARAFGSSSFC